MSPAPGGRRFGTGWLDRRPSAPLADAVAAESWSNTPGWREFLDLLGEAIVVFGRDGRIRFANTAALRLLPWEVGAGADALPEALGGPAVQWLREALAGEPSRFGDPPAVRLPDGRRVRLDWRALDARHSALRLTPRPSAETTAARASAASNGGAPSGTDARPLLPLNPTIDFLWDSPFPATLQGADFRLIDVNPAFVAMTGQSRDALIGRDPRELLPPADRPAIDATRRLLRGSASPALEPVRDGRLIDAGGRERRVRVARRTVTDTDGSTYHLSLLQDTTAEHSARERADRSLRELDDWFELSPVGMVLLDERGVLLRHNAALISLTGMPPATLAEADPGLARLLGWERGRGMAELEPEAPPLTRHANLAGVRGAPPRSLRAVLRCYRSAGGERRTMAIVEDRSAEEASELAQLQIGALMETAGVGLATFQESSGWMRLNPGGGADTGASNAASLQSIGRELVLPESLGEFEQLQSALREARRAQVRYAIRHPELGKRWLMTRVEPATLASGTRTTSVVTLDITEQHETQQRTEQLLHELGMILESTTAGIAYLRDDTLVRCNRRFEAMLGLPAGSAEGQPIDGFFADGRRTGGMVVAARLGLARDGVFEAEVEAGVRAGNEAACATSACRDDPFEPRWYSLSLRGRGTPERVGEAVAVLADISRLKAQQRELEVLARDRELMFNFADVGIAMVRDGRIQRANEALARFVGLEVAELAGRPHDEVLVGPEDDPAAGWPAEVQAALVAQGPWSGERRLRSHDGRSRWVQLTMRLLTPGDPAAGMIVSYVDVDARHRAARAIAQQAERTRAILDSALVGIVTVGVDGIEWMNRSARRMFGGELDAFAGLPLATVATPEADHPFRRTAEHEALADGQADTFECRLRARDGREFWVVGNVVATGTEAGSRQWTYALLDIERRRQAEARVSETREQLQRIIESAPLAITLRDARTLRVLQANDVAARSFGRSAAGLVGRTPEELFDPTQAALRRADMEAALASSGPLRRDYRIERRDGMRIWDARYLPLAIRPDAPPDQLLLVATDVTEQRAAQEARVEAAIAQREMLVKEVHHRIKNNLQGVAGLLQQIAEKKPEVAGPIAEVVGQVQAIAQVYGLQVGTDGPLGLVAVVQAIAASVQRTFGHAIRVEVGGVRPGQWMLPEAESIPIALTLNELLTNAIKHCGEGSTGRGDSGDSVDRPVDCTLLSADGEVEIRIGNPGRLPEGFDLARIRGGVSGLGLVRALLPRRSAELKLVPAGGRVEAWVTLRPPGVRRVETPAAGAAADPPG